jgi:formylglycine-generating enzyme required for sulfatase activity
MSWLERLACMGLLSPALVACTEAPDTLPPIGQILLFIDTDAPLPPAPGSPLDVGEPPALFDHLRIDVARRGGPEDGAMLAQRDFVLHRALFETGPLSIGIAPPANEPGYVARARLYRGADARGDVAAPSSTIDRSVKLPVVGAEGITLVRLSLNVDDTGTASAIAEAELTRSMPTSASVGTWPGATRRACTEAAQSDEACVPGGAFWMGDPQLRNDSEVEDAEREHLVVVSPFFIDTREVTVGDLRAARDELLEAGATLPPQWSGSSEGLAEDDYSTFTLGASEADPVDEHAELPVNGVLWPTARAYCLLRGKDLPSEAMFEFVASGRGLEQKYVWGDDAPDCADAVSGRAGFGVYATFDGACRASGDPGGVLPAGAGRSDRVQLGGSLDPSPVVDLAGNLSEWMLDWFNAEDEAVWVESGVLYDPVAGERGRFGDRRSVRGGSWRGRYVELRAAARVARDPAAENRSLGFRCARRP